MNLYKIIKIFTKLIESETEQWEALFEEATDMVGLCQLTEHPECILIAGREEKGEGMIQSNSSLSARFYRGIGKSRECTCSGMLSRSTATIKDIDWQ